MGFKVVSAMINCRGRARMAWGLRRGWWGGRTAAVMIRVTGALLSDAWAKTYEQVSKPRVGRVLTEMGGWSVWTAGQPMQLEQNGGDGREGYKSQHSQEEGQPCFLPAFFLLIPGSQCLGKKQPPRFLCFPLLCWPHSSLPGLLGTYVAPEEQLGNADSGSPLEKSISDKKGC